MNYLQKNILHLKYKTKRGEKVRGKKWHDTTSWSSLAVASNSNNWTVVTLQSRHVQSARNGNVTCGSLWTKQNIPPGNVSSEPHKVIWDVGHDSKQEIKGMVSRSPFRGSYVNNGRISFLKSLNAKLILSHRTLRTSLAKWNKQGCVLSVLHKLLVQTDL